MYWCLHFTSNLPVKFELQGRDPTRSESHNFEKTARNSFQCESHTKWALMARNYESMHTWVVVQESNDSCTCCLRKVVICVPSATMNAYMVRHHMTGHVAASWTGSTCWWSKPRGKTNGKLVYLPLKQNEYTGRFLPSVPFSSNSYKLEHLWTLSVCSIV